MENQLKLEKRFFWKCFIWKGTIFTISGEIIETGMSPLILFKISEIAFHIHKKVRTCEI